MRAEGPKNALKYEMGQINHVGCRKRKRPSVNFDPQRILKRVQGRRACQA